jgi:hypothetical protein
MDGVDLGSPAMMCEAAQQVIGRVRPRVEPFWLVTAMGASCQPQEEPSVVSFGPVQLLIGRIRPRRPEGPRLSA